MQDGNDKGFSLYDEVGGLTRDEIAAGADLSDLFREIETSPGELLEEPRNSRKRMRAKTSPIST